MMNNHADLNTGCKIITKLNEVRLESVVDIG